MGRTTALRREIDKMFVPFAEAQGFTVDRKRLPSTLCFYRIRGQEAHLFDIQFEKYGRPRFVVNFGICPAEGLDIDGKNFTAPDVFASWTREGGRLQPLKGASSGSWFRQDKPFFKRLFARQKSRPAEEVVAGLLTFFPEVEMWWASRRVMPHIIIRAYPSA